MHKTISLNQRMKRVSFLIALNVLGGFSLQAFAETAPIGNFETGVVKETKDENVSGEKAYVIGPTNLIFIKVLGEDGLQQTYRVDESGYITHPLLGRVNLSGKTVSEAETIIQQMLKGDYILNPNVTIFVIEHSRFSILGEVRKPGNYEILGRLSLIEGLSIAGGFTPVANQKKIKILRHEGSNEKTIIVNVKDVLDGKEEADGNVIKPGDVIEVPVSFF